MGYDLVVLDASGSARLDHAELLPQEHAALLAQAAALGLSAVALLPPYWGEERQFRVNEVRTLDRDLSRIERLPRRDVALDSAVSKLRRLVSIALQSGSPLEVVPD